MRRGGRGEERDTTTHLIFKFLPTLVVLLYLARLFQDESRESWSSTCTTRLWEPFRGSEIALKLTDVQRTDLFLWKP